MKIVISPAKSLNYESELPTTKYTSPEFIDDAEKLNKLLAKKKPKVLAELMSISDNLAQLNWQRNQDFETPFTPENSRQAIYAFNGDVYQGLDAYTLSEDKIERLQKILRILSGQYGILRPLDLMQPYRLEMGTSLKVGRKKNLYEYWGNRLTEHLNNEMEEGELLVNLASNEYYSALKPKNIRAEIITPIFKDWKNDKLKIISFFAKKARGSIKCFNLDDYEFSQEHTIKQNEPVFIR